jgi:3-oxoacyl-[acyl-carrier protein] reductase
VSEARRVVAVTGGTGGIGLGVARQLAVAGAAVVVCGRRPEVGAAVVAELRTAGLEVAFVAADVSIPGEAEAFVAAALDAHGRLDVLVNNAGTVGPVPNAPFAEIDEAAFDAIVDLNLKGTFFTAQAAARAMAAGGGGTIINIASAAGEAPGPELIAYRASKAAVLTLSRSLALALAPEGIIVHTVSMRRVATDGGRRTLEDRLVRQGVTGAAADAARSSYAAGAVAPDDVGRGLLALVDDPTVRSGPGFDVRP